WAVRLEGHRRDIGRMPPQQRALLAGPDIPEPDRPVLARTARRIAVQPRPPWTRCLLRDLGHGLLSDSPFREVLADDAAAGKAPPNREESPTPAAWPPLSPGRSGAWSRRQRAGRMRQLRVGPPRRQLAGAGAVERPDVLVVARMADWHSQR